MSPNKSWPPAPQFQAVPDAGRSIGPLCEYWGQMLALPGTLAQRRYSARSSSLLVQRRSGDSDCGGRSVLVSARHRLHSQMPSAQRQVVGQLPFSGKCQRFAAQLLVCLGRFCHSLCFPCSTSLGNRYEQTVGFSTANRIGSWRGFQSRVSAYCSRR
jgi:hypothetical protein